MKEDQEKSPANPPAGASQDGPLLHPYFQPETWDLPCPHEIALDEAEAREAGMISFMQGLRDRQDQTNRLLEQLIRLLA